MPRLPPLASLATILLASFLVVSACEGAVPAPPGVDGAPTRSVQDEWARNRVESVLSLYNFSGEAKAAIRDMQVLHVVGRPGWFGSTGYKGFVGIGSARPRSIVHEISHSFWGIFPVDGQPDLTWDRDGSPGRVSPGIAALRRDLERLMAQPPDSFEPIRDRLRVIPDLVTGGYPGLYHLGEAEIVNFTGGNLALVPPILRKYYGPWLDAGPFGSWDEAARWYLGLPEEQKRIADAYFGIRELGLQGYEVGVDPESRVDPDLEAIVEAEERQRLADFAEQFDVFFEEIDGTAVASDTQFWRGYLQGLADLHRSNPEVLDAVAPQQALAKQGLDFLLRAAPLPPDEGVPFAQRRIGEKPFLLQFAAGLPHPTLAGLSSMADASAPESLGGRLRAALDPNYVQLLDSATRILSAPPVEAATAFEAIVETLDDRQLGKMNLILEVFGAIDREATRGMLTRLSPETALLVYRRGPAFVRFLLEPEELIDVLGYQGHLTQERLTELAQLINDHVVGFRPSDEPFLDSAYRRIIELGRNEGPGAAIAVFQESGLLLEPFLERFPQEAAHLLAQELQAAAEMFRSVNPVRLTPARAIYLLIQTDPVLAANVTLQYEGLGDLTAFGEALFFFAFDAQRLEARPGLTLELSRNGEYLRHLLHLRGLEWLAERMRAGATAIRVSMEAGETSPDTLTAYSETVDKSLDTLFPRERQDILAAVEEALG